MVDQGILQPTKTPGGQRRFDTNSLNEFKEQSRYITAPQNPAVFKDNNFEEQIDNNTSSVDNKPVDPRNTLNDLNGSQWLPETKSFFYQKKGWGQKHPHAQIERQHPAPFSYQDIEHLITFSQKKA
ncbi:MAG: hypothetical protein L6V79_07270 [Clostridium sp.]|nr:MAG: hypothetical protein L6V79_07270 [Clostridium sp.]